MKDTALPELLLLLCLGGGVRSDATGLFSCSDPSVTGKDYEEDKGLDVSKYTITASVDEKDKTHLTFEITLKTKDANDKQGKFAEAYLGIYGVGDGILTGTYSSTAEIKTEKCAAPFTYLQYAVVAGKTSTTYNKVMLTWKSDDKNDKKKFIAKAVVCLPGDPATKKKKCSQLIQQAAPMEIVKAANPPVPPPGPPPGPPPPPAPQPGPEPSPETHSTAAQPQKKSKAAVHRPATMPMSLVPAVATLLVVLIIKQYRLFPCT